MIKSWKRRTAARRAKKDGTISNDLPELIIPSHFRCPITLDLMTDPVTLSTGITYDRQSIDTWMESGNHTCPVTNQVIRSQDPIPNHTIRKMIQDWCVLNTSFGIDRIPTPRIPLSSHDLEEILFRVVAARQRNDADACYDLIVRIKRLAKDSERNKRCIVSNGTGSVLSAAFEAFSNSGFDRKVKVLEELISVLTVVSPLNEESKRYLSSNSSLLSMVCILKYGALSARRNTLLVLNEISSSESRTAVGNFANIEGSLDALVKIVKEPICPTTTKAALVIIYRMISSTGNEGIIATLVEMGLVETLLEIVVDLDRSMCEKSLGVLDGLCGSAEGRERAYNNSLTIPVLVKKVLRVSDLATEFAVSLIWKLSKNEKREDGGVLVEAVEVGAFQKLLLLLQVGSSQKTKDKANQVLKMLNVYRERLECIDSMDFRNLKRPF